MRRTILLSLLFLPFLVFSQGNIKKSTINWISLENAKEYSEKYNQKILIYFYKHNCEYCEKMQKETLNDINIINLINNNFLPVKIDSRTKDTIEYNGKKYTNQQPESSGRHDWRHDFYAEVTSFKQNNKDVSTTPSIVIFNSKFQKIKVLPGIQSKPQLLRSLNKIIK
ncbi:MAG: thioredoxin fold domain-containing protein [Flavobacteriales bacterium]